MIRHRTLALVLTLSGIALSSACIDAGDQHGPASTDPGVKGELSGEAVNPDWDEPPPAEPSGELPAQLDACGHNALNYGSAEEPQCVCVPGALECGERCLGREDQRVMDTAPAAHMEGRCLTAPNCYGQSFTPTDSGWLTEISFDGEAPGRQTLTIYEGTGSMCASTGPRLHEQQIDTSAAGWKHVLLATPVWVEAGHSYTFQLQGSEYWLHGCSPNNVYSNGDSIAVAGWDIAFATVIAQCP